MGLHAKIRTYAFVYKTSKTVSFKMAVVGCVLRSKKTNPSFVIMCGGRCEQL
jgi:hypothetical protein